MADARHGRGHRITRKAAFAGAWVAALLAIGGCKGADGAPGKAGAPGVSCSAADNHDGTSTIACTDGTSATVSNGTNGTNGTSGTNGADGKNGTNGTNGASCTVTDNGNGTATLTCPGGGTFVVRNGGCTVTDNGDGTRTIRCSDGSVVTVASGVVDYRILTAAEVADANLSAVITAVAFPADGRPLVTLKVSERHGLGVRGLAGASVAPQGRVTWQAALLKLTPGVNGSANDTWVSYVATNDHAEAVAETAGAADLTDGGDGTYVYRFRQAVAAGPAAAGTTFEPGRVHRLALFVFAAGAPFAPVNLVRDFVPAAISAASPAGGDLTGQADAVDPAACLECHRTFRAVPGAVGALAAGRFHSGAYHDVRGCVACHNDQARFAAGTVGDDAVSGGGLWSGVLGVVNGEAASHFPVLVHKLHMGRRLALTGGVYAGVRAPYALTASQDPGACARCHRSPAPGAARFHAQPSRRACGACHDAVTFVEAVPPARVLHTGGAAADDAQCASCHSAQGAAGDVRDWHGAVAPPAPDNVYLNTVSGSSDTNAAFIAAGPTPPAGADVITAEVQAVSAVQDPSITPNRRPVIVFKLKRNGVDVVFPDRASATELLPGFVGAPSACVAFAVPQDGIVRPADYNVFASAYLRSVWNRTAVGVGAGSLTGPDAGGFYTLKLTGVSIPPTATLLAGAIGFGYGLGTAPGFRDHTLPPTQIGLPLYPFNPNPGGSGGTGGLVVPTREVWATGTGYEARRSVVDAGRCDACHAALGVGRDVHAGQRYDGGGCAACHGPNATSTGWSAEAKQVVHAIHAAGRRAVSFTWRATSATEGYWRLVASAPLEACEACHLPGTHAYGAAADAVPRMLVATVGAGRYNASALTNPVAHRISPYVAADNVTDYGYGFSTKDVTAVLPDGNSGTQADGLGGTIACTLAAPCRCTAANPCTVTNVTSGKKGATICSVGAPCTCVTQDPTSPDVTTCTLTVRTCTTTSPCQADPSTLVVSPITGACVGCHDAPLAIDHARSNGGSFYEPRTVALGRAEQCLLCHGAGKLADIDAVHRKRPW